MTLIIILMYLLGCKYYFDKKMKWLKKNIIIFQSGVFRAAIFFVFLFLASLVVLVCIVPNGRLQSALLSLYDYWVGLFFYLILFLLLGDLITMVLRLCMGKRIAGLVKSGRIYQYAGVLILSISLFFCIYGFQHSKTIEVSEYQVSVDKHVQGITDLNIVMISDLHLGYATNMIRLQHMVDQINMLQPDLIIIAGDIFNNDYDQINDPGKCIRILSEMKANYGTYAVYGNHDVTETLIGGFPLFDQKELIRDPRMTMFVEQAGIKALSDQVTTVADGKIYLVGRLDLQRPGDGSLQRKSVFTLTENLDHTKPILMIDHEPVELEDAQKNGVDLLLSGHTHDGQFFPFTLFQRLAWKNPHGCMAIGNMYSCVTSGTGTYAPGMRVFTSAEIMQITVHFQ